MSQLLVEESLLREPNLWTPNKKPIGIITIDRSNPLTNGMVRYWQCNSLNDINGNRLTVDRGTVTVEIGDRGPYLAPSMSAPYGSCAETIPTPISGSQSRTVLGEVYTASSVGGYNIFTIGDGDLGSTGARWTFRTVDEKLRIEIQGSGWTTATSPGTCMTFSNYHFAGCRLNGTTLADHTIFCDGSSWSASGVNVVNTSASYFCRLGQSFNMDDNKLGIPRVLWLALWNRALSNDEIEQIRLDPYQLVKPA